MESRSGTGRAGVTYFYYACPSDGCGLRVVAAEVEGAVIDRLRFLAEDDEVVGALVDRANTVNQRKRPPLAKQLRSHERTRQRLAAESALVITRAADPGYAGSAGELAAHLDGLTRQKLAVEKGIAQANAQLDLLSGGVVTAESIRSGLRNFARVYEHMKPYEKRELIRTILSRAQIGDRTLILDIYETACAGFAQAVKSGSRSEPPVWLPGSVSQSVLRDAFTTELPSLEVRRSRERRQRRSLGQAEIRTQWSALLDTDIVRYQAVLARHEGVSRARVSQVLRAR